MRQELMVEKVVDLKKKRCPKCLEIKPLTDFCKRKDRKIGRQPGCKKCDLLYRIKHHAKRLLYAANYRLNHKEEILVYAREYIRKNKEKNKDKIYRKVRTKKESGSLIPLPCSICGFSPTQAHHPDYSKPLEVIWLCPSHHKQLHADSLLDYNPGLGITI